MSKREADKMRRQIEGCDAGQLRALAGAVAEALYPGGSAGASWSPDTLDDVARALRVFGVGPFADPPEARPSRGAGKARNR